MKKIFLTLTISLLFSLSAFSQSPNPSPTAAPTVKNDEDVVKISTALIQVDATVLDRDGKIVERLTADDFEIYENGKKQKITNFSFVGLQPDKSSADKSSESQTVAKSSKNSIPIPSVPANLRPEQVRRTMALVVDDLDLSFASVDAVRSALKKYVDEQMQPGDLVAIIRTGGGAGFLQQFTSDKRILYKAIDKVRWNAVGSGKLYAFTPSNPSDTNFAIPGTIGGDIAFANKEKIEDYNEDVFAVGTLGAINYVVKGMSELPGRKAVVLFSEGFVLYEQDRFDAASNIKRTNTRLTDAFHRLTESANRSSVTIYTVDTRGVVVPMPDGGDSVRPTGGGGKYSDGRGETSEQITNQRTNLLYETQQGLRALADQTGGFAVINNNNLSKGIERVLNDQNGYYLLGYQPDEETFDSKKNRFNKLTVKLKRPDLQVRYRSGFFGVEDKESKSQAAKTPQQQILAALTSPISSGDIDLRLTSLFANDAQTGNFMRSLVYVGGDNLKFTEDADGWGKATFDVAAMIFGDNGAVVDQVSRTETIKARTETLREIREKGFVSTITVPIKKPGAYQMRLVIRDTATSRIGSASQFIEVPDLKKDYLTLSGILMQRVEPQQNRNGESGQKQFQPDEQRDVAIRSFSAGMNVRFGYAVYNAKADKAANSPKLKMRYKIFRDGKEIFASKEMDAKLVEKTDLQHLQGEGIFTLGKAIQTGDYVLQIIVKDASENGKNQIATQWIDFQVSE